MSRVGAERTMEEGGVLRAWDIVERDPGVSPVYRVRDGSSSAKGSPLFVIQARQESKGAFEKVVRHGVRVSQTHQRTVGCWGLQESKGERYQLY